MSAPPLPILLMGPTASGKSALAMHLAARCPAEIVSVDSAQVYLGMDIGTAKPTAEERAQVPHHLIDLVPPTERYSAARFAVEARAAIADVQARGRVPLVVGGTMLYFRALLQGLSDLPVADPAVRAAIDTEAARVGWPALHAELARVDPQTAARLEPADRQRIQRALEVFRITGQPMSALLRPAQVPAGIGEHIAIALEPSERAALHRRIAQRFETMLAAGLVEEVRSLRARYALDPDLPSMRAVGYRQAWQHLDGEFGHAELRERGIYATRQLAKRQLTWLRSTPAERFDCLAPDLAAQVAALLEARGALRD